MGESRGDEKAMTRLISRALLDAVAFGEQMTMPDGTVYLRCSTGPQPWQDIAAGRSMTSDELWETIQARYHADGYAGRH